MNISHNPLDNLLQGILWLCAAILHYDGVVDDQITRFFNFAGIYSLQYQLYIMSFLAVFFIAIAVLVIRGMMGWFVIILIMLLMLDRFVPRLNAPGGMFNTPIQKVL
jgi:hypothetical protein